ncbi:MAG: hypothetical protein QOF83_1475, partial [Solirubrobacteraceae bacterium]|nr:hypothetical protein [Solirubrobacteraceae bacterium]
MSDAAVVLGAVGLNGCFMVVGYALLAVCLRSASRRSWLSYAPVALLLGAGTCGVSLEILVLIGLRADLPTFAGVAIVLSAGGLLASRRLRETTRRRLSLEPATPVAKEAGLTEGVLATAFCCFAVVLAVLILFGAFRTAPWLDDSWTFWIPKGLSLGNLGLDPRMFTPSTHYVGLTHRSYPVFWSITAELAIRFAGHIDLRAVTGELAVLTVAFAGAIVRVLSGRVRPALLWFGVALFLLSPEVAHQTQGGGADLVLGIYLALFVLGAFGWIIERNRGALVLTAAFGSVALATKVEALPEFAICAVVACLAAWHLDRRTWRPLLGAVFAAALSSVPWFVWAQLRAGKEPRADYGSSLNLSHGIAPTGRLGPTVHALGAQALSPQHWLLIVPVTVLLCLVLALRERKIDWLAPAAMILVIFAFFVWVYWFDSRPLAASLRSTGYRVFVPMALLSAAALPVVVDRVLVAIPRWEIAVAGLPCAGALAVVIAIAAPVAAHAPAPIPGSPPLTAAKVGGKTFRRWVFSPRFAPGWTTFDGLKAVAGPAAGRATTANEPGVAPAKRPAKSCLTAVTGESAFAYQLIGPKVSL